MNNSTTINIDTSKLTHPLNAAVSAMNNVSLNLNEVKTLLQSIVEYQSTIRDCIVHIHDSHLHNSPHACEDRFEAEPGKGLLDAYLGPVDLLIREYQHNLDCDGNGLIYGKDFIIKSNDPDCPPQIKQLSSIINPYPNQITWEAYKNTIPIQLR